MQLYCYLDSMNKSKNRSKSQALAIYLCWLRLGKLILLIFKLSLYFKITLESQGISQDAIAIYFGSDLTQQEVSEYSEQVRNSLEKSFISKYLGVQNVSRESLISHNTPFTKEFCNDKFNEKIALIADGTYLYCGKSSNNKFQK